MTLVIKTVEYPAEKILDLQDLTLDGLNEVKFQLKEYEQEVDDALSYLEQHPKDARY